MPATDGNATKLIPVTKWNEHHHWPPIGGLRHLIFNAHKTGFDSCVRRVGRRVLIDEAQFFEWIRTQEKMDVHAEVSKMTASQQCRDPSA